MFRWKLFWGIAIPLLLVAVAAVPVVVHWLMPHALKEMREEALGYGRYQALVVDGALEGVAREAREMAAYVAATPSLGERQLYDLLRAGVDQNPLVIAAGMAFEADGKRRKAVFAPFAYWEADETREKDLGRLAAEYPVAAQDWYARARDLGHGVWTGPMRDMAGSGQLVARYSEPIVEEGRFLGVALADVDLRHLRDALPSAVAGRRFIIVDDEGTFVYHTNPSYILELNLIGLAKRLKWPALVELDTLLKSGGTGLFSMGRFGESDPHWVVFTPLVSTGWMFASAFPEQDFVGPVHKHFLALGQLFAAMVLISLLLVFVISRRLARPLGELSDGVLQLELDDGEPDTRGRDGDEFFTLARGIAGLGRRVQAGEMAAKRAHEEATMERGQREEKERLMRSQALRLEAAEALIGRHRDAADACADLRRELAEQEDACHRLERERDEQLDQARMAEARVGELESRLRDLEHHRDEASRERAALEEALGQQRAALERSDQEVERLLADLAEAQRLKEQTAATLAEILAEKESLSVDLETALGREREVLERADEEGRRLAEELTEARRLTEESDAALAAVAAEKAALTAALEAAGQRERESLERAAQEGRRLRDDLSETRRMEAASARALEQALAEKDELGGALAQAMLEKESLAMELAQSMSETDGVRKRSEESEAARKALEASMERNSRERDRLEQRLAALDGEMKTREDARKEAVRRREALEQTLNRFEHTYRESLSGTPAAPVGRDGFQWRGLTFPGDQGKGGWFECLPRPDGQWLLALSGDAGEGPEAVLGSSLLQALVTRLGLQCQSPAALLEAVDEPRRQVRSDGTRRPLWLAVYDPGVGHLRYVNDGLPPPLCADPQGRVSQWGSDEPLEGKEHTAALSNGETLLVYVPPPGRGEDLEARLRDLLGSHAGLPLEELASLLGQDPAGDGRPATGTWAMALLRPEDMPDGGDDGISGREAPGNPEGRLERFASLLKKHW